MLNMRDPQLRAGARPRGASTTLTDSRAIRAAYVSTVVLGDSVWSMDESGDARDLWPEDGRIRAGELDLGAAAVSSCGLNGRC